MSRFIFFVSKISIVNFLPLKATQPLCFASICGEPPVLDDLITIFVGWFSIESLSWHLCDHLSQSQRIRKLPLRHLARQEHCPFYAILQPYYQYFYYACYQPCSGNFSAFIIDLLAISQAKLLKEIAIFVREVLLLHHYRCLWLKQQICEQIVSLVFSQVSSELSAT